MQLFASSNTVLTGITYQAVWLANLIHDAVAGIYAGSATNTFHLHTIADVYTCRTHFYTSGTINAITMIALRIFLCHTARITTFVVIRNNHGVLIQQHTLQPTIRANRGTHLLSEER